ncbi:MAG TPA: bifunctional DedA family/phosphatase PAP2 family protein [Gemmatimonadaceae bacterium]|nr:bifunctional DedA family/phosphatase PAP2 family protein [Gemmatimonadaceae bacterium]
MLDVVSQWVAHYGYVLVALFLLVEGAGVPVPGETALVTAAALAGRGTLSLAGVIIAGAIGTILGGHTGYWIGARGGTRFVHRHGKWVGLSPKHLERTRRFFDQHGSKTVLLGRFVAVVRSFVGIFAGITQMPMRQFATYNAIGGSVWVAAFSILGYVFGRNLPRLVHDIGRVSLVLALLIAVVVAVVFLWRWFAKNRTSVVASLEESFERAAAGPRVSGMRRRHPRAFQILSGRYAHSEYLAVHLGIGFVISLAVIAIFASITEGLVEGSPLTRFDVTVANYLRQSLAPSVFDAFNVLSSLGARGAMTLLLFAGAIWYAVRRRGLELAGWVVAFIGGSLLDASLRFVVRRSELPFADLVLLDWGTGLASGHALGVVLGFGMLAYLLYAAVKGAVMRMLIIILATALIVAIVTARLYLGQGYVSDVSAGVAAGFVWLAACISGIEIARQRDWKSLSRGGG